ncbi:Ras-like protein Ral-A [Fonticula alba]|uniref:Ras-like protein Ral-A n=1 Tax=Fonticula alba TaxID=691883 RepID=A0A058ZG18_FONAL|nr:Ras-like protein Ral-A [Fonticula alba]KCV73304.1 Ras-like protein Ral-A [Fonticula alba]|eukprot:XP_009493005.1 Ras-like protein Ral-A [Fonticula alba]
MSRSRSAPSGGSSAGSGASGTPALHKLIVVGLGGVGKTAIIFQYVYGDFISSYDPTKADSYRKKIMFEDEEINIDVLDTSGQEEYAAIRDNYYRCGEGFLCVFSLTERETLDALDDFIEQIHRVLDDTEIPIILVGNKSDLERSRAVFSEEAQAKADHWKIPYYETSAKTRHNIDEVFTHIIRSITQRKRAASTAARTNRRRGGSGKRRGCVLL